jgi:hypothetical protein
LSRYSSAVNDDCTTWCKALPGVLHMRQLITCASQFCARIISILCPCFMQVDIVVDETYAPAPAAYTYDQFLKEYDITPSLAAGVAFLNGTNAAA